ncbi:MAG: hypothetical protein HY341_01355, partial [Candidatus Kerfeldbacteria bacterium]|nr:hypothetical protein [Candidatus Kerfeldbacteria bacterium]
MSTPRDFLRLPLLMSVVVVSFWFATSSLPVHAADRPDLDVLYVERTPRYSRYDVTAAPDGTPRLRPGTEFDQRWPNPDELVTFTAHVANYGDAASPATTYTWSVDGTIIASGTVPPLAPADERTFTYRWRWQDGTHRIRFAVDPGRQVDEITDANNVIDDRTNALSFHFHAERSFCRAFLRDTTAIGSFSCADWLQQQVAAFNAMLDAAIYDLTPAGAGIRIRIDRITEEVDGSLSPFDVHAPDDREWDGRWGFPWAGAVRTNGNCANGWCADRSYVEKYATKTDWGLMRQLAFALGLPDRSALDVVDHEVDVRAADGTRLPATGIVPKLDGHVVYVSGCPQEPPLDDADCDERGITADRTHHVLSAYDAAALERNADFYRLPNGTSRGLPKRRGYTADFQLDLPTVNTLRVLDQAGDPLPRARVEVYQRTPDGIPDRVKYRGTTDSQGRWSLPAVTEARYGVRMDTTTPFDAAVATPEGLLRSVGPDASQDRNTLLLVVTHGAATDVEWLDVTDFNTAFWRGATGEATYTVPTTIDPVSSDRILVTGPGAGGGPNVRIFTPMGAPLVHFFAYHESFRGGVNVAVGDVDGDGKDEIITASGPGGSPHVRIFSNRGVFETGFFAYDVSFTGGVNVAVGDVDRDGRA